MKIGFFYSEAKFSICETEQETFMLFVATEMNRHALEHSRLFLIFWAGYTFRDMCNLFWCIPNAPI